MGDRGEKERGSRGKWNDSPFYLSLGNIYFEEKVPKGKYGSKTTVVESD